MLVQRMLASFPFEDSYEPSGWIGYQNAGDVGGLHPLHQVGNGLVVESNRPRIHDLLRGGGLPCGELISSEPAEHDPIIRRDHNRTAVFGASSKMSDMVAKTTGWDFFGQMACEQSC